MNQEKIKKWLRGAAIAAGGAVLGYLSSVVMPSLEASGATIIAMLASAAINAAKLYFQKLED